MFNAAFFSAVLVFMSILIPAMDIDIRNHPDHMLALVFISSLLIIIKFYWVDTHKRRSLFKVA